ncbi:MAG: hypothetical protein J6M08_04230 [Methanobrevibacter sp.]|nr:hypothetical protein [Methanobrevibacter sp.]
MVNTTEEIMLTVGGRDNASQMFGQIDANAKSMASSISSALSSINMGMMNLGQVTDNVMQGLTGKSAMDNILGTTSKAETNAVLLKNMLDDSAKHYDAFYERVDKTTDSSLTSMQELIPALKAFKSATGATDKEMTNITDEMANFGAAVLAQTGSTDLAQQSMMDLSKGVKGAFASLDQYGITQDALERTGYWNGDEKDVEGFMKAVQKVTGSTEELMETNTGLDALIGKSFSRAGKKIGNEFLPIIKDIKRGFIDLDNELGGGLAASMLVVSGGIDVMNQGFWNISTTVNGIRDLKDGFVALKDVIKGTGDAAEAAGDAINTVSNISDMGAGAAGVAGAGASAAKGAGKSEKAIEGGMDALMMADILKGEKNSQKDTAKWLKEIEKKDKTYDKIKKFNEEFAAKRAAAMGGGDYKSALENIRKDNKGLSDAIKLSASSDVYDDAIKEWESSGQSISEKIKSKSSNFKSRITDAFSTIRNFDFKGTLKSPFAKLSNFFSEGFGTKLQNGLQKGFSGLGNIASTIKTKFSNFGSSIANIKNINVTDKLKGAFSGLLGSKSVIAEGSAMMAETAVEMGTMAASTGTVAAESGVVAAESAAAGAEMTAASGGVAATSAGATSLSAAFTSMIVPLLALSATIIIMIPIVAFIAAEAMVFLKLLADFMQALNFDSVNLDGAVDGISQIATALAWVGVAMAAMSFAGIMTGIAVMTGGFLGIMGPLDIAVNALKEAGKKLSEFNTVKIDESVATTIQTIGTTLSAVSSAMGSLTWSNIVTGFSNFVADVLGFSSVTDGLEQAKNDIIEASNKLNEFSGITPLDDSVANNIQNVCDSLASVGDAMGALRSIRDGQNWDDLFGQLMTGLFGEGVDIQTALLNVKDDIIKASQALAQFTGISEIPEDVGTKITKVSDTLSSVNDAFQTLRSIQGDSNWDSWMEGLFGGTDIASALDKIKTDLITASQKLAELSSISEIGEDVGTKIQAVGTTLGEVSEVTTSLTSLPDMGDFDISTVTTAVTNVQNTATELAKLNETTFDGSAAGTVLGSIQTTLQSVKDTLSAASGFSEVSTSIGSQIVSGVQSGIAPLGSSVQGAVSSAISSASGTATTGGNTLGRNVTTGLKTTLQLKSTMATEVGYALSAMTSRTQEFYDAGAALGRAANEGFQSTNAINPGSPGNLAHVMMDEVGYILDAMKNKYSAAYNMAKGLGQTIYNGFGNPSLDMDMFTNGGTLTAEHIGALQTTISKAPDKTDNRPVTIIVEEGAVSVDARNHTVREAQKLMITAFEGMDHITDVDVDV